MGNGSVNARRPLKMAHILRGFLKEVPEMERCSMWVVMGQEWKVPKKMEDGSVNARRPLKMAHIMKEHMKTVSEMEKCSM